MRAHHRLGFQVKSVFHLVLSALILLVGFGVMKEVQAKSLGKKRSASLEKKLALYNHTQSYDVEVNEKWPLWGNKDAKVVILKFGDFQCPFCRLAAFNIKPYLQEFKDQVQYRYVNFPLRSHQFAEPAARAGYCANTLGDFWPYHDKLYKNQRKLNQANLIQFAQEAGFNKKEFVACMESDAAKNYVQQDLELSQKLYLRAVPTVMINGRPVKYWRDGKLLQAIVKQELKK